MKNRRKEKDRKAALLNELDFLDAMRKESSGNTYTLKKSTLILALRSMFNLGRLSAFEETANR